MPRGTLVATSASVLALVLAPQALQPLSAAAIPAPIPRSAPADVDGPVQIHSTNRQPILVFDVSGGTLLGPVQSTVVVWSGGDVTYSHEDAFERGTIGATKLSSQALAGLLDALHDAGANSLQDQWPQAQDVPLRTVTVLDAGTDAFAHTFSYRLGTGAYADIDAVLDLLMAQVLAVR